uniref:Uncharacterized protein n=1 Tax=Ananas comosus var. bracteatus TaxID=296719 RepID=A0A6V7NRQ6_ANACO|nr:unnamed protein product [Ananas comosus var. bracteatus]
MELRSALSTSSDTRLLSKDIAYSMKTASQGNVIGASHVYPNSSSDILNSSAKILLLRYANGTMSRFPSILYKTQCPFSATEVLHASLPRPASLLAIAILLIPQAAILCHFFAIAIKKRTRYATTSTYAIYL